MIGERMKKIFICAGDVSGDLHAASLINNISQTDSSIKIFAIGGENLAKTQASFLYNIVNTGSFGISHLLKKYLYFKNVFKNIVCPMLQNEKPDLVILVDFYGFNIHIAKEAKRRNIKVIYYICPQIWASRFYRIKNIKKYVDEVIPIFPFEVDIYKKYGIEVYFAGNPLIDIIRASDIDVDIYQKFNLSREKQLIGIMPGSRKQEIKRILPIMLQCLKSSLSDKILFILFVSSPINKQLVLEILDDYGMRQQIKIIEGSGYSIRKRLRFCLTCSGTATTENLILNLPMMIFYRMSYFAYFIAGLIIKIKFIGMPNIFANRHIVPEYIQFININKVSNEIQNWINSDAKINKIKQDLNNVAKMLGEPGVLGRVSAHITDKLSNY